MTDQSAQTDQDRRHLRAILDMAPECIKLVTRDGILIDINPAGLAMIDATSLDAVRGTEIAGLIVPEHRARFASMLDRVFSGERCTLAFEIIGFKGRRLWMDTHVA
jgi:PAS domain S-box-containing protein